MSNLKKNRIYSVWGKKIAKAGRSSISKLFISSFRQFNSRTVTISAKKSNEQIEYYKCEQFCSSGMTLETENFLYGNLLWEAIEKKPVEVLKILDNFYEISGNPLYRLIASDICRYLAKKTDVEQSIQFYLSAYYFGYQCLAAWKEQKELSDFSSSNFFISSAIRMFNETVAGIFRFLKNANLLNTKDLCLCDIIGRKFFVKDTDFDMSVPPEAIADFSLCSDFNFNGLHMNNRHGGIGVALVASVKDCKLSKSLKTPQGLTIPVTLIIRPDLLTNGNMNIQMTFVDTLKHESFIIGKERLMTGEWMLSRDYTTPFACFLNNLKARNLLGFMLHAATHEKQNGLFLVEPYAPDKIPVVFVHGLMSSAETWGEMFNSLKSSSRIRRKYQFWFYSYSTGCPVFFSAAGLHRALREAQKEFCTTSEATANFEKMVIVGHSMGGLLTRCMLQQDPWYFLKLITNSALEKIKQKLSAEDMKILEEHVQVPNLPFVKRVIFMAVPHRGSKIAEYWIAKLGIRLTKLSKRQLKTLENIRRIFSLIVPERKILPKDKLMTGISNLSPNNSFVKALGNSPLREDVIYHSIIGNNKQEGVPGGTDGIVPYDSSHIDNAASECIVKSNHSVHQRPLAIYELMRILLLHLKENGDD